MILLELIQAFPKLHDSIFLFLLLSYIARIHTSHHNPDTVPHFNIVTSALFRLS